MYVAGLPGLRVPIVASPYVEMSLMPLWDEDRTACFGRVWGKVAAAGVTASSAAAVSAKCNNVVRAHQHHNTTTTSCTTPEDPRCRYPYLSNWRRWVVRTPNRSHLPSHATVATVATKSPGLSMAAPWYRGSVDTVARSSEVAS
ncbi:hypothetical protein NPX13_g7388 [Xylaria arbuscula]|uniref:Uncharacterized protein n=1 Tax=Xylaria arbuscula TaxID=114810 RepID=A0A9W8NA36_9PEZI|nr:hypothetical protein NPX13_g7388 [Xylaria arbuscula]